MGKATAIDVESKEGGDKKKEEKEDEGSASFFTLLRYADCCDWTLYFFGLIGAIFNGIYMPAFSLVFGEVLDAFNTQEPGSDIMPLISEMALLMALVGLGGWIAAYIEIALFTIAAERQARRIREHYFAALVNQDVSWFDKTNSNTITTRVADETRAVRDGIGEKLGLGIRFVITFVSGVLMGFWYGWQLTLLLMAMSPFMAVAGGAMMALTSNLENAAQKAYAKAGAIAQERLAAMRTVQAFGGQKSALKQYGVHLDGARWAGVKKGLVKGGSLGITNGIFFIATGVAFWFGAVLVAGDRDDVVAQIRDAGCSTYGNFGGVGEAAFNQTEALCSPEWAAANDPSCLPLCASLVRPCIVGDTCQTGGDVVLVLFTVLIGAMGIGMAGPSFGAVATAKVSGYKLFGVIDNKVSINVADKDSGKMVSSPAGQIEFRDVGFRYPSRPDKQILNNLTITIEAGTTVALVGRSGCGKSTVVALLQRFYDAESGGITVDGTPITDINVGSLRASMGYVGQEPILFATTIRENIMYGMPSSISTTVTDADVESACRMANAYDFIMKFPDGLDTLCGEGGIALSGGQKQRVAIARALIRKPKILLLDEATSALDSTSEHVVQKALDKLVGAKSHTTVVIAHRLSTIKNADKIIVMDEGHMAEVGTHTELMEIEGGIYRDLVEAQMSGRDGSLVSEYKKGDGDDDEVDAAGDESKAGTGGRGSRSKSVAADGKEEESDRYKDVDTSFGRLIKMNLVDWPWIIVGCIGACFNAVVYPAFAVGFSEMINLFYVWNMDQMRDDSVWWCIGFCIVAACTIVGQLAMWGSFGVLGSRLTRRLRSQAFDAMLHHEMAFHDQDENNTGALTTQLATDATLVNALASERIALSVQSMVTIIVGLTIAFLADWRLTLIVLGAGPILAASSAIQMAAMTGSTGSANKSLENAGQIVQESVHGIRTVAAFNLGDRLAELYSSKLAEPQKMGIRAGHMSGLGFGFSQFAMMGVMALVFFVGGLWVAADSMTFNDMMKVMMAVMMTANALGETSALAPDMGKAKSAVKNIFGLLDMGPKIVCQPKNTGKQLAGISGDIEFKDIVFSYPTRKGRVMNHFNLSIRAGQTVALVGTSGSGKSTTVQLMQRFYDPDSGVVTLDGTPLNELDVHWLRQKIGIVSQEPTLFQGTVFENIAYGVDCMEPDVSQDRVEAAARAANAHDFIMELGGYDQEIKPDSLSGGQKQRVAIARAILRKPRILLLDEATSALDNRSEHVVQAALDGLMSSRETTTIVIAHRLTTIKDSDVIVVMERGDIIEQGSHEELCAIEGGKYAEMWQQQSLLAGGGELAVEEA